MMHFDPFMEVPWQNLIWTKFPSLPLELWNIQVVVEITKRIDAFYIVLGRKEYGET